MSIPSRSVSVSANTAKTPEIAGFPGYHNLHDAIDPRVHDLAIVPWDGIESLGIFAVALLASAIGPQWALGLVAASMLAIAFSMWALMPLYRHLQ